MARTRGALLLIRLGIAWTPPEVQDAKVSLPTALQAALERLDVEDLATLAGLPLGSKIGTHGMRAEALNTIIARRRAGRDCIILFEELATITNTSDKWESSSAVVEPFFVRVVDHALETRMLGSPSEVRGLTVVGRPWRTFSGERAAARQPPEVWDESRGAFRQPNAWCEAQLVTEAEAIASKSRTTQVEQWSGVQPRSEVVEVTRHSGAIFSYMGQTLDSFGGFYSEVLLKAEHMSTGGLQSVSHQSIRNLSSLLFPLQPSEYAQRYGYSTGIGDALEGILFRELALYRGEGTQLRVLDSHFPWIQVFPSGKILVPILSSSILNYGHWISKGLSHLVALWDSVANDESVVFLIYQMPFIIDTFHFLLGDAYSRRVYLYNPKVLYFAVEALGVGPDYFALVDNLSKESGAIVRNLFLGVLAESQAPGLKYDSTLGESIHVPIQPPIVLLLDRSENQKRGRAWANFNEVHRSMYDELGNNYSVRPYICGDHTLRGQMFDFASADIVVGLDGACFGNALWMRPGSAIVTIVPAKTNYIPIMPVKACGYTYAWKLADVANVGTFVLPLPFADANDLAINVPVTSFRRVLRAAANFTQNMMATSCERNKSCTVPESVAMKEREAAILPGPMATQQNVMQVYSLDLLYDAVEKGQIRLAANDNSGANAQQRRSLELFRRHKEAMLDAKMRRRMIETLRKRCATQPGCTEDRLVCYVRLLEYEQGVAVTSRSAAADLLSARRTLLQHRPSCANYLFKLAEQLEVVGSMDGDTALLREAMMANEASLRSDAEVSVLDETTRYKAWEMIILLAVNSGDWEEARRWLRRAQASGYPWHNVMQLPYSRMYHPIFVAKPFWDCRDAPHLSYLCAYLEEHHLSIQKELRAALRFEASHPGNVVSYTESASLVTRGNWTQIKLAGDDPATKALVWREEFCGPSGLFSRTCTLLRGESNAYAAAITGSAKFYLLAPNSHLKPHCGQGNVRLFVQLGVIVPQGSTIRVGGVEQSWREGHALILDDSFLHEASNVGRSTRVTLNLPVWHPDIYHRFLR